MSYNGFSNLFHLDRIHWLKQELVMVIDRTMISDEVI